MINFDNINSIPVEVTVKLGKKKMLVSDLLNLTPNSIVELDSKPGDLFLLSVNGKDIAKGEIVTVNGNYAFRIVELINEK